MSSAHTLTHPMQARIARRTLSPRVAFYLQASMTTSFLAGSSAPTPLYRTYQAAWGFSPVTITFIFGIYAIAVLVALLVAGRLSDYIGRRPVLLVAALAQAATMALFATAGGVTSLLVARALQGLAAGAAVSAVGAGLLDLDKARGTIANAIAPLIGTALGGVVAGLMVRFLPFPTQLVYVVLGVVFLLQAVGIAKMAETVTPRTGALSSLKPQFNLPRAVRGPLLLSVPVLVAAWALGGFYASLGPTLVRSLAGSDSVLLGGLALFVLAASAALAVLALQRMDAQAMMSFGAVGLILGVAISLAAVAWHSLAGFFIGTLVAGVGFGPAFQGAVRMVVPLAGPRERAGVLSVIFVVSYLSLGGPAVFAGYLAVHTGNILVTARDFGTIVMALATLALIGTHARPALAGATRR
jgi:predicted MFS family arabinose efflux permease